MPGFASAGPRAEVVVPPPSHVPSPVRALALTPGAAGYWLAGSDGSVVTGGDAVFYGSAGNQHLRAPIVAMAATPDGAGYWLAASDGGIMTYGDAGFFGSAGNLRLSAPIIGMAATPDGAGYWLAGRDGGVMTYGDAGFYGAGEGQGPMATVVSDAKNDGYVLAAGNGTLVSATNPGGGSRQTQSGGSQPAADPSSDPQPDPGGSSEPSSTSDTGWSPSPSDPGYVFMYPDGSGGTAARWNPCAPIRYAVNLSDAPASALDDAQAAVARVSAPSGIAFSYVGTTDFVPDPNGPGGQLPQGIDAVIGWVSPSQISSNSKEVGVGGNWWEPGSGVKKLYQGYVLINGDLAKSTLRPGFNGGYSEGHLLLHELGHMLGLNHTGDPNAVMYPQQSGLSPTSYGPGDQNGLSILGSGGCI